MRSSGTGRAARRMVVMACVAALGGSLVGACQLGRQASTQLGATATLSPTAYADELTAALRAVGEGLDRVAKARTYDDLLAALSAARQTVLDQEGRLRALPAPDGLRTAHYKLLNGFVYVRDVLGEVGRGVKDRNVCGSPAAMADLSRSIGMMEDEARALSGATGGRFQVDGLLPARVERQDRRLRNGTMVRRHPGSGPNELIVENRREDVDVVFTLYKRQKPFLSVYVARGGKTTVRGIPNGAYRAYYTSGEDWDRGLRGFTRRCDFARYDELARFSTTATHATAWLFWVSGGGLSSSRAGTTADATAPGTFQP